MQTISPDQQPFARWRNEQKNMIATVPGASASLARYCASGGIGPGDGYGQHLSLENERYMLTWRLAALAVALAGMQNRP